MNAVLWGSMWILFLFTCTSPNLSTFVLAVSLHFAFITSPAAANETQVVESGHLVLDGGCGVTEFGWVVLIVSRHYRHQCAIRDVTQGDHLVAWEGDILERLNCTIETLMGDRRRCQTWALSDICEIKKRMWIEHWSHQSTTTTADIVQVHGKLN